MRIGLITDTHIPWAVKELPHQVAETFRGVDLILHAGDIYSHVVLDELERIAPVLAAQGDDDYPALDRRVREKHILKIEGHTVWLIHEGPYIPLSSKHIATWCQHRTGPNETRDDWPTIIVSGHEHRTHLERYNGLLYVNSGSATLLNYRPGPGTVGIMELAEGRADVDIIQL